MTRKVLAFAIPLALAAGCQIPDRTFDVNDAGTDQQELLVTPSTLNIPEGMTGSFDVTLRHDPLATVTAVVSSSNVAALPVDPTVLTFTPADYAAPHTVTVAPPVDTNAVAETASIMVSGGGAPTPATVMASVIDSTVVKPYGWPAPPPFDDFALLAAGSVIAYQITVDAVANLNLDAFGVYVPAGSGFYRMALYRDAGNVPGALIAQIAAPITLVNGANLFDLMPDAAIDTTVGTKFWIALRISQNTAVSKSTTSPGLQCFRNQDIPNINDSWPATFGTPTCQSASLVNLWITTYHQ